MANQTSGQHEKDFANAILEDVESNFQDAYDFQSQLDIQFIQSNAIANSDTQADTVFAQYRVEAFEA